MKNIKNICRQIFRYLPVGVLFCLLSSCEKFVQVDLPVSQLTKNDVYQDYATANAAVVQLYIKMRTEVLVTGSNYGLSMLLGNYADELTNYSVGSIPEKFFQNNLIPSNYTISNIWNGSYNLIYSANDVYEGVAQSSGISQQDKTRLQAEALFVRAYVHFYLLNLFGPIPYIKTTDYRTNKTVTRTSTDEVYKLILSDLDKVKAGISDQYISDDRVRPNRSVVTAMLARVNLYTQNWDKAESDATEVIENTALYTWVDDLNKVFLKGSTGTLWQLMPNLSTENTLEGSHFVSTKGPPSVAINDALLKAFENGDQRKALWIGSITEGANTWYFPYKYKQNRNTASTQEYSILFRLEELYLIRAEARARQGNYIGTQQDLNKIRERAGLEDTPAHTEPALIDAILKERRVEFFTEHGHRWFDLKRTGQANAALTGIKPGWNPDGILWPLPENELLLNPNLSPQNTGY